MRVAVVTPYHGDISLRRCRESVWRQTHSCSHIIVADDNRPSSYSIDHETGLTDSGAQHLICGINHNDIGGTPRALGALSAASQGFDAIAFLDADNWFEPDHIETMLKVAAETGADVVGAQRWICRNDGSRMFLCSEQDEYFVDTSCQFWTRKAFPLLAYWALVPEGKRAIGDRWVTRKFHTDLNGSMRVRLAPRDHATVNYVCAHAWAYAQAGEPVPEGAKQIVGDGRTWKVEKTA